MLLGVDVGGTFTDAVLVAGDGGVFSAKVPSTPAQESRGVLRAVAAVLTRAGVAPGEVERFAHGMTVATNALLEGRTARTALIATEGFTDVLELGRQDRAHLYDLCLAAPEPLVPAERRFAAPERVCPEGTLRRLEAGAARELVEEIARCGPEAVAVSLLYSYAAPEHERLLGELLEEFLPDVHRSLSHELVGTFREYERTASTALDAALSPLLGEYLRTLSREAGEIGLVEPQVMQSSGGLTDATRAAAHAALTVLSGPAGGVGGALLLAELAGVSEVLCFDMGGTSCDVCVIEDGRVRESAKRTIAGRPLSLAALDIHTVGAGGGSIAWRDPGGALRVGPASAGAEPGPACYGRGGLRASVTDANLLLGRLLEDSALAGGVALEREAAEHAVGALARELEMDLLACAEGIVRVAEAQMLGALRLMSVERGLDPRAFALMAFGGAGPLHAASMARELGIAHVLCPRASGVLSALGLAAAAPRRDVARTVMLSGAELSSERLEREREELVGAASQALGASPARLRVRHELRYVGQSFELAVEEELGSLEGGALDPPALMRAFERAHEEHYGYHDPQGSIELVNIRASAWGHAPALAPRGAQRAPASAPEQEIREIIFEGSALPSLILRGEPAPGDAVVGPALWALAQATLLVPPGWSGEVDAHGTIHLRDRAGG